MTYDQWRITYQSGNQAAQAAWVELCKVTKERDELLAHCERLTSVLIDVESESTSGYYDIPPWLYSDVITAMNAKPEQSLEAIKNEANKDMANWMINSTMSHEYKDVIRNRYRSYNELLKAKEGAP